MSTNISDPISSGFNDKSSKNLKLDLNCWSFPGPHYKRNFYPINYQKGKKCSFLDYRYFSLLWIEQKKTEICLIIHDDLRKNWSKKKFAFVVEFFFWFLRKRLKTANPAFSLEHSSSNFIANIWKMYPRQTKTKWGQSNLKHLKVLSSNKLLHFMFISTTEAFASSRFSENIEREKSLWKFNWIVSFETETIFHTSRSHSLVRTCENS